MQMREMVFGGLVLLSLAAQVGAETERPDAARTPSTTGGSAGTSSVSTISSHTNAPSTNAGPSTSARSGQPTTSTFDAVRAITGNSTATTSVPASGASPTTSTAAQTRSGQAGSITNNALDTVNVLTGHRSPVGSGAPQGAAVGTGNASAPQSRIGQAVSGGLDALDAVTGRTPSQAARSGSASASSLPGSTTSSTQTTTSAGASRAGSMAGGIIDIVTGRQSAPSAGVGGGPVGTNSYPSGGVLQWKTIALAPSACTHNGDHAVCAFRVTNQGAATMSLKGSRNGVMFSYTTAGSMRFIDDGHAPHEADQSYFVDAYGNRQPEIVLNSGQSGTYIMEFQSVYPQTMSGEFQLDKQLVGNVRFVASASNNGANDTQQQPQAQPTIAEGVGKAVDVGGQVWSIIRGH